MLLMLLLGSCPDGWLPGVPDRCLGHRVHGLRLVTSRHNTAALTRVRIQLGLPHTAVTSPLSVRAQLGFVQLPLLWCPSGLRHWRCSRIVPLFMLPPRLLRDYFGASVAFNCCISNCQSASTVPYLAIRLWRLGLCVVWELIGVR